MKRLTEEDMAILRMIAVRTANVKYDEDGKKTIFNLGSGTIIGSGENQVERALKNIESAS